jgi:acyl carrier protein
VSTETELVDQDTRAKIRSIIVELAPEPEGARTDGATRLVEDLAYHSLALLELGFTLEDEFDLPPIDQEQVQHITTVEEIVELVLGLLPSDADSE